MKVTAIVKGLAPAYLEALRQCDAESAWNELRNRDSVTLKIGSGSIADQVDFNLARKAGVKLSNEWTLADRRGYKLATFELSSQA